MGTISIKTITNSQIESIHLASLSVLEKTGLNVTSRDAAKLFISAGAIADRINGKERIRLPQSLVEGSLALVPKKIVYRGRTPEADYRPVKCSCSITTFGECTGIIDLNTGQYRQSVKQDCCDSALVLDYLDEIKVIERPLNPSDMLHKSQPLHNAEAIFTNSVKHSFIGVNNVDVFRGMTEIAAASVGGSKRFSQRKNFTVTVCPVSPLLLTAGCCNVIMEAARQGVGLLIFPMPLAGATSPVTTGGTMVVQNAEILGSITLAQLVSPGTPCTYGSAGTIMDLTRADASLGAPEMALIGAGSAAMARFYSLPSLICGGLTDSKAVDLQAGYEAGYSILFSALSGGSFISGAGVLEQGLTFDYAKLIFDLELYSYYRIIAKGIDTSPESLALEEIDQVGLGGEYLSCMHTYKHMHSQYQAHYFDRRKREAWQKDKTPEIKNKAYEQIKEILKTHKPSPLKESATAEIKRIISDFENMIGDR